MSYAVLNIGWCVCKEEPRGSGGLEGFALSVRYRYNKVSHAGLNWYHVFPDTQYPGYWESCTIQMFNRFFQEVEDEA